MRASHRGHTIEVTREPSMAGNKLLFWSIFRDSDGYECDSGFEDSDESVRDKVAILCGRIDAELADDDPWLERETGGEA